MPAHSTAIHIDDPDDPRLADFRFLRDRDLRRIDEGLFVGEQALVVERMLARPGTTRSVLIGTPMVERMQPLVPPEVTLLTASMELLERIAGFPVHRGVLAIGVRSAVAQRTVSSLAPESGPATVLVCEEITHADNMGQLFRIAAALGADGVLLSPGCHDPLYRRCLRVSIGHALTVPWCFSDDWPRDLGRLRDELHLTLVGAATGGGAVALDSAERPPRVAVAVGTEFAGLSETARDACDALVRIPMVDGVDSLNVAVAAAICLHRFTRADRR